MSLNVNLVELNPHPSFEHVCSGIGADDDVYGQMNISINVLFPSGTKDRYIFGSNSGLFDANNNFTRVSLQNGDEMLIISESSNRTGCEVYQEIHFMLNITDAWNGGTISCSTYMFWDYDETDVTEYKDEQTINVIPSKILSIKNESIFSRSAA